MNARFGEIIPVVAEVRASRHHPMALIVRRADRYQQRGTVTFDKTHKR
ncbi:hypothetical protein FH063_005743 [Azospirillum argentinense]|uniref:Uncharacterized protein n=1 Tax=Azospirillum argentinense TaxID=2970906 RepID=A0A5B0KTC8_9PROT|nr:hypothetical protein FH063_005743 [Azospirillum argentinense]